MPLDPPLAMTANFGFWYLKVRFVAFAECLSQYHGLSIYSYALGNEEAQTNAFV